ncbi:hypothetical protein GCM10028817_26650 [Spirosoma pomorum]
MERRFNPGRAVSADHTLFAEAIEAFRPQNLDIGDIFELPRATNYIMLSFEIDSLIETPLFRIGPTVRVHLGDAYVGIVAPVTHPTVDPTHNSHLVTMALAAVLTFISQRPVTAPRDDHYGRRGFDDHVSRTLALQYPILRACFEIHKG